MTIHLSPWLLRRKWMLVAVGLPILVTLWWAFRPEKLWINQTVNEPAPFDTSGAPEPILTGRFEGNPQTNGRATIFKQPGGGEYLRLSDFTTTNGSDVHVLLARSEADVDRIDLGPLKNSQGDQNYDFPAAANLGKYQIVILYSGRYHTMLGSAKLDSF
ncbi:MAG TPA: DM13 domain-containing protein [Bryobacteraceae bacterium]|nr:DM13 domain-containing protein [Bryobacteraceae bacterium]